MEVAFGLRFSEKQAPKQRNLAGKILIIGIVMYFLVSIFASTVFGGLITQAVQSLA